MEQLNSHNKNLSSKTPTVGSTPILHKLKSAYLVWHNFYHILPKLHKYTLGERIDNLFIEIIEYAAQASFLPKQEKQPYIKVAIRKLDTLKILLNILWESQSLDDKKYILISEPLTEIGRMFGGWHNQLSKQNSPDIKPREK